MSKANAYLAEDARVEMVFVSFCRNSPVWCDVFPRLNLLLWKTDTPALQVPEAILIQTLEKGTEGLAQRRKEEFKLWENSKLIDLFAPL